MNNLVQSNAISVFNFKSTPVRTQLVDNNIWFCLVDVCDSLALKRNSSIIARLDEKGCRKTATLTEGGIQELNYINEPNLYRLVFRSNKPAALQFAKWVYEDVLPSIRKTGSYGMPAVQMDAKTIGGIVKKCVHKALVEFLTSVPAEKAESWEVSDQDLLYQLHCWHATRNKADIEKMREIIAENADLKNRMNQISNWVR
jgi:prophage antirepressor-like protein|nr:MAG TPA: hypothetical protein [Caudoviricetes sp.]